MTHKNDYSVIVFLNDGTVKRWLYVHNLYKFAQFLDAKHSNWLYMNVYDRRKNNFLRRIVRGSFVPPYI